MKKAKHIFTGAAPTPVSLIKWFSSLNVNIQEAYAMTENTCYSHVTFKEKMKTGYVGQPLPFCDVKLSEKNEILIKHDALMDGYYKNEEETKRICEETIKSLGVSSIKDMGKIMGSLKKKYSDTIDFSKVNLIVKGLLNQWNIQKNILTRLSLD